MSVYRFIVRLFARMLRETSIAPQSFKAYQVTAIESGRIFRFGVVSPSLGNAQHKAKQVCPSAELMTVELA